MIHILHKIIILKARDNMNSISNLIYKDLQKEIRKKIKKALRKTFKTRKTNLNEPYLIKNLIYKLVKQLNSIKKRSYFHIYSGGIFIHQRPKVKKILNNWNDGKGSVELGDLVLINTIVINNCIIKRTALLMQAKKGDINKIINPDNVHQLDLYTNWPEFEYVSGRGLKNKRRHINRDKDKDIDNGVKYLFINTNTTPAKASVTSATKLKLDELKNFSDEIYDFVTGSGGKEFKEVVVDNEKYNYDGKCKYECKDKCKGWCRVIADLIDNISILALPQSYQRAGYPEEKRGIGLFEAPKYLAYKGFESTPIIGKFLEISSIIDESNNTNDIDEISGISMIEIIIKIDYDDTVVI